MARGEAIVLCFETNFSQFLYENNFFSNRFEDDGKITNIFSPKNAIKKLETSFENIVKKSLRNLLPQAFSS